METPPKTQPMGAATLAIARIARLARHNYGLFASPHEAVGVLLEEVMELQHACHENDWESFRSEAMDIAAVCLRIASEKTQREIEGQL